MTPDQEQLVFSGLALLLEEDHYDHPTAVALREASKGLTAAQLAESEKQNEQSPRNQKVKK